MAIYSTLWDADPAYNHAVRVLDFRRLGWGGVLKAIAGLGSDDVLIANGALGLSERWRDLVMSVLVRPLRRGTALVVSDATWVPRSMPDEWTRPGWRLNDAWGRWLLHHATNDRSIVCFLSRSEVAQYLADPRAPGATAVFTPFHVTIPAAAREHVPHPGTEPPRRATGSERYVFSGGDTLRDWRLLCEALGDAPVTVRVACRDTRRAWPANFRVAPTGPEEFFRVAAGADAAVLALRSDTERSAGQQTYLNMLRLGLPTVVTEAPGVRDHLEGLPGAVTTPSGDAAALRAAVAGLLGAPGEALRRDLVRDGLRQLDDEYSTEAYLARLVRVAEALDGGRRPSAPPSSPALAARRG